MYTRTAVHVVNLQYFKACRNNSNSMEVIMKTRIQNQRRGGQTFLSKNTFLRPKIKKLNLIMFTCCMFEVILRVQ